MGAVSSGIKVILLQGWWFLSPDLFIDLILQLYVNLLFYRDAKCLSLAVKNIFTWTFKKPFQIRISDLVILTLLLLFSLISVVFYSFQTKRKVFLYVNVPFI